MSQINLKKQIDSLTFTPDANYVSLFYSSTLSAWAYKDENGVVYTIGSQSVESRSLYATVRNQTGSSIAAFKVVYVSGASGNKALISLAQANYESTSSKTFGVTRSLIANNTDSDVIVSGLLNGVDTSSYAEGDVLWLSPSVAGGVTTTKPTAPNHAVFVGIVTRSHPTSGTVELNIQNGYELDELHDVNISGAVEGQVLKRESGLWTNKTIEYVHTQSSASNTWTVNHNLGFNPSVQVFSAGGMLVDVEINHITVNQTQILFLTPFSGTARFN